MDLASVADEATKRLRAARRILGQQPTNGTT
ncbi:hypothetical protein JOF56_009872 [Kibdelosporangium banguiense]|uniref:XRE family transcriptional regulator n=1 Tax=Kibdelosporangium banguiense TaxID=1365924 RepID=A0ABS4TYL1_9PSEU|nr:hypothetical protein [Kibdelosporangium banguiense]